jgi:hypothetical protein
MQRIVQSQATAAKRRIRFILELAAARNEVQTLPLNDIGAGDSFTLTVPAYGAFTQETTGAIAGSATPSTIATNIKTALDALTLVGAVTCASTGSGNFTVTFDTGNGSATDMPLMTIGGVTGFAVGGVVVETTNGGPIGWPAKTETITVATELFISKNGGTQTAGAGTVTNEGNGAYYYECALAEIDTLGYLGLVILDTAVNTVYPTVEIIEGTSEQGFYQFTAAAGATNSITMDGGASSVNDYYKDTLAVILSGTGAGQARYAWAYNGTTKVLSTEPAWATNPDTSSVVELRHISPCLFELLRANHLIALTIGGELASTVDVADQVEAQIIAGGTPIAVGENGGVTLEPRRGTA